MALSNQAVAGNTFGAKSIAFGTAIRRLVPPMRRFIARISKVVVTAAGTAHTLTVLRSLGRAKAVAAVAASGTVVTLDQDPGPSGNLIAANDLLAIRETDGVTRLYTVSSVSGLAITLTGGLTAGVAAGGDVWDFGITSDTDPKTGEAHQTFTIPASLTTTYSDDVSGIAAGNAVDEPILLSDSNGTATGTIEQVSYAYTNV